MSRVVGFQCGMCGVWFMLKANLDRHKETEISQFVIDNAAKRAISDELFKERYQQWPFTTFTRELFKT